MKKPVHAVILMVLLFMGLPLSVQAQDTPYFEEAECPFEVPDGQNVDCGYLVVPENRSKADSPDIYLAVAIIRSPGSEASDPLIYLEGGPGGGAIAGIDAWYNTEMGENRDIILIDQRGTGYSEPSLNCPELDFADEDEATQAEQECYARLVAEGVDIGAYTTVENAADIEDLRIALDYDQVNLLGISYGTRLALEVIENHPDGLRSVIIDSVYPQNVNAYAEQAVNFAASLQSVFDLCAADSDCNAAYPDLGAVFYQMIEQRNNSPMSITDSESGEDFDYYGDDVVREMFDLMYDTAMGPFIPALIYAAYEGNADEYQALVTGEYLEYDDLGDEEDYGEEFTSPLDELSDDELETYLMVYLELDNLDALYDELDALSDDDYDDLMWDLEDALILMDYLGYDDIADFKAYVETLSDDEYDDLIEEIYGEEVDSDSEGMFNTVECNDEVPFQSAEDIKTVSQAVNPLLGNIFINDALDMLDTCAYWKVPTAPARENQQTTGNVPTLILSGSFDPITPPVWGAVAEAGLTNDYFFTFPGVGHGAIDGGECPLGIAVAFLNNPTSEPDSSCIAGMAVDFYTGN